MVKRVSRKYIFYLNLPTKIGTYYSFKVYGTNHGKNNLFIELYVSSGKYPFQTVANFESYGKYCFLF